MNERNEQGFVKDISLAIEEVNKLNISSEEKVKTIIELPFDIEDISKIDEYINQLATRKVDCNDLWDIAILNQQIKDESDEALKSHFVKRHDEKIEALMNEMEGVLKMYNEEDLNVQPENPTVELPNEVQTPQIEEFNPTAPQVEEYATPEITVPTEEVPEVTELTEPVEEVAEVEGVMPEITDPVDYIEPANVEAPEEPVVEAEVPEVAEPFEVPEFAAVEEYTADVPQEVNEAEEMPVIPEFEVPEEPVAEVETPEVEAPVEIPEFPNEPTYAPFENQVAEEVPVGEPFEVPEEPVAEVETPEIETPVQEVPADFAGVDNTKPEEDEMDDAVREIADRYEQMKNLEIRLYNNQKKHNELAEQIKELETEIDNDQMKIEELRLMR